MATLLAMCYPNKAAKLLAYKHTILCAQRDFEGTAWVTYDTCYWHQAAAKKSLDWSQVDFNSQQAKAKSRCRYCLSKYHRSGECCYTPHPPFHQLNTMGKEKHIVSGTHSKNPPQTGNMF